MSGVPGSIRWNGPAGYYRHCKRLCLVSGLKDREIPDDCHPRLRFLGIPRSHLIEHNLGNVALEFFTPLKPPIPGSLLVSRNKKIPAWT